MTWNIFLGNSYFSHMILACSSVLHKPWPFRDSYPSNEKLLSGCNLVSLKFPLEMLLEVSREGCLEKNSQKSPPELFWSKIIPVFKMEKSLFSSIIAMFQVNHVLCLKIHCRVLIDLEAIKSIWIDVGGVGAGGEICPKSQFMTLVIHSRNKCAVAIRLVWIPGSQRSIRRPYGSQETEHPALPGSYHDR